MGLGARQLLTVTAIPMLFDVDFDVDLGVDFALGLVRASVTPMPRLIHTMPTLRPRFKELDPDDVA